MKIMNSPLVSIIIPFFNRVDFVIESIESVLAQDYSNYEVILINDGSTESIERIVNLNLKKLHLITQSNQGPAAARNKGVSIATGKYIFFLDSDDIYLPNKISYQVRIMEENPGFILSHSSYDLISIKGDYDSTVNTSRHHGACFPNIVLRCKIATPTVCVRRESLADFKFNSSLKVGEDIVLWTRLSKLGKFFAIDKSTVQVRLHGRNASRDVINKFSNNVQIMNTFLSLSKELKIPVSVLLIRYLLIGISAMKDLSIITFKKTLRGKRSEK